MTIKPSRPLLVLRCMFVIVIALKLTSVLVDKAKIGLANAGTADLLACSYRYCETVMGQGDARWYLEAGRALADGSGIPPGLVWVYSLWPPGMAAINALMMGVLGADVRIGLVHGAVNIVLWTALLAIPLWIARTPMLVMTCGVVSVALTWATIFPDFILGFGLLYADGISTAILLLAYALLIFGRRTRIRRSAILIVLCSGLMIGFCAYLRSSMETLVVMTTLVVAVVCASFVCTQVVKQFRVAADQDVLVSSALRRVVVTCRRSRLCWVFVALLLAQAVMFPWRLYVHEYVTGKFSFSSTGNQIFAAGWTPASRVDPRTVEWKWYVNGFCEAYPVRCGTIERDELRSTNPYGGEGGGFYSYSELRNFAVVEILSDPTPWIEQRGMKLFSTWWPARVNSGPVTLVAEAITLGALAYVMVLAVLRSLRRRDLTPIVLVGTLLLITLLLPMASHFEERYLFAAKALAFLLPYFLADLGPARIARRPEKEAVLENRV
jgi:hypothetical protein